MLYERSVTQSLERKIKNTGIPPSDLISILKAGVPVDLPDGEQLRLGVLRPESLCIGKPTGSGSLIGVNGNAEILAIFRKSHLLLRKPETVLQAEDQVMVVVSSEAWPELAKRLAPLSSREGKESREFPERSSGDYKIRESPLNFRNRQKIS